MLLSQFLAIAPSLSHVSYVGFSEILGNAFQKYFCGAWAGRGSSDFFFSIARELHPAKDGGEAASLAP